MTILLSSLGDDYVFDLWQQLKLSSEFESDPQDLVDWDRK